MTALLWRLAGRTWVKVADVLPKADLEEYVRQIEREMASAAFREVRAGQEMLNSTSQSKRSEAYNSWSLPPGFARLWTGDGARSCAGHVHRREPNSPN